MGGFSVSRPEPPMKTVPDHTEIKTRLRKELRLRRASLDETQRRAFDAAINSRLIHLVQEVQHRVVAAYLAFDGEPDLESSLLQLAHQGATLALPVIHEVPGRNFITFRHWLPGEPLRANRFGILEPDGTDEIPISQIDLCLVPLVGWDRSGSRLGMGASYYDRAFQSFVLQNKPVRMGVGYGLQETGEIPLDPWDIRLHAMLTENGWFTCAG